MALKCVAVSDIHLRDVSTPDADLLIVAGDMTMKGTTQEMQWFSEWLGRQPQKHKVWIAGNHEFGLEEMPSIGTRIAEETCSIYLDDTGTKIEGTTIWGSPITPFFHNWAFNRHRGADIRKHWLMIPEGLDILITHGPPYNYLDIARDSNHVGCEELLDVLLNHLRHPPRYHIFGHIHGGYGTFSLKREDGFTIELLNASTCDEKYKATNEPLVFEV